MPAKTEKTPEQLLQHAAKALAKDARGMSQAVAEFAGNGATVAQVKIDLQYWASRVNRSMQAFEGHLTAAKPATAEKPVEK